MCKFYDESKWLRCDKLTINLAITFHSKQFLKQTLLLVLELRHNKKKKLIIMDSPLIALRQKIN
jgi:hypothetical protein